MYSIGLPVSRTIVRLPALGLGVLRHYLYGELTIYASHHSRHRQSGLEPECRQSQRGTCECELSKARHHLFIVNCYLWWQSGKSFFPPVREPVHIGYRTQKFLCIEAQARGW